ncbi:MAG: ABC transporter permease [Deltaproteobacteria bacterium]|nr:ABC transporter permease [Deltaproteobacteria bacterium]
MLKRLKHMLIKEFLQIFRDPRMRMIIFGAPIIQLIVLSFALTMDVSHIRTGVLDFDNTPTSREVLHEFTSSGYFSIDEYIQAQSDVDRLLDQGVVRTIISVPAGFERDFLRGATARLQLIADGTDSNTTAVIFAYANQIMSRYTQRKLQQRLSTSLGRAGLSEGVVLETRAWFNPNLESKYYYVPGLIAVMLILVSMLLASINIVREKEIGTIEQVMVTPISRLEFILGKTVPFLIIGYIIMTLMLIVAMLIFDIRIKGDWVLFYALTGIYLIGNLGLALLISVSATTQQQALLTAFFILMPAVLLSGFIFPINNMPLPVQYATFLNPMRWYLEILRGVLMKGVGFSAIRQAIVGQSVLAVVFIMLATQRFRKTLR